MKLALGTVQFGLDYGITNKNGQIGCDEAVRILDRAAAEGIDILDTASAYGSSETVIGDYGRNGGAPFNIVSKTAPSSAEEFRESLRFSLFHLGSTSLYGYLFHDIKMFFSHPDLWQSMEQAKEYGQVRKVGFSLYHPSELEQLMRDRIPFDILQVPFSILDQRFAPYFDELHRAGVEVHVRSVFLQGVLLQDPSLLHFRFSKIEKKLRSLHALAREKKIPVTALCLGFASLNPSIDRVVIGVDNLRSLEENIAAAKHEDEVRPFLEEVAALKEQDENIILPNRWKQ